MIPLVLVLLLSPTAFARVIQQYTNARAVTSAIACEIDPFSGASPTPLILRWNSFVYPTSSGETTLKFYEGETIDFACPGGQLVLEGSSTNLIVATASCVSGSRFIVNNASYLWQQIQCSTNPSSSGRFTGNDCEAGGSEVEIGFEISSTRFASNMVLCFDRTTEVAIYSFYNLIPAIRQQISGTPRPSFTQGTGIFTLSNVNRLYTTATQRVTINGLLGLPSDDYTYIQNNNNYFMARGHLTARSDFFYAAQQNSTFHFANALPQWQTFNGCNWEQTESDVRDYASRNNATLQIWTGGWGVTTLPHAITGEDTELYLYVNGDDRALPVPDFYWKVVYRPLSGSGVALIGVNNPYKDSSDIDRFCEDVSDSLTWLKWKKDDQSKGISWACTVTDFRRVVKNFPDLDINELLI
ncbi:uncharacterized protein [Euwallacea fornicatus]|uniref:uncharacterized protein n=1 Tax=Euwallacea fornicatus TaxID=995702 RepID=UPI00338E7E37